MLPPVCLFLIIFIVKCCGYQNSWNSDLKYYRTPQDIMVDVVNNLAMKLLGVHNGGNDNNIAISPYGAVSVLVALEEGLQGGAATEIRRAANIPSDLSIVRIGLRDIHRHLKSYFIPEEGFLSGLTLSHDNVTLNREYEDILRFYGFDINSFNNAFFPDYLTTESPVSTTETTEASTMTMPDSTTKVTTEVTTGTEKMSGKDENGAVTATTEGASTVVENERITSSEPTTLLPESTASITQAGTSTTEIVATTKIPDRTKMTEVSTEVTTSTEKMSGKDENGEVTEAATSTTDGASTVVENGRITRSEPTTLLPESTTGTTQAGTSTTGIMTTTKVPDSTEVTEAIVVTTSTEKMSGKGENGTVTEATATTTDNEKITRSEATESTTTTSQGNTAAITTTDMDATSNFMTEKEITRETQTMILSTVGTTITEATSTIEPKTTTDTSTNIDQSTIDNLVEYETVSSTVTDVTTTDQMLETGGTTEYADNNKTILRRNTRSVVDYIIARYYDDHALTQRPPPYNSENDLYFLINGKYKESNINYMTYDTVLPFFYVSQLNTLALRFPLDSSKYYLLLLLPENHQQIHKLLCELRLNTSLKYIIDNLRYTHVKAIIPSFMLKGNVVLTSTFQKIGINRVFEPRQADFTPMTGDRGIYVTNIEQAITVNIRNYVDPETMNNNRYLHRTNPQLFKADHPFLYFVIDSEIDVTLMAGKVVNPLNSRIR